MDIEEIISRMTLEDKIALCSGESFWETKKYEKYEFHRFLCATDLMDSENRSVKMAQICSV